MKPVRYWALVLSATATVAVARVSDVNTAFNVPQIVPKRFIMEVDEQLPPNQRSFFPRVSFVSFCSLSI